MCKVNIQWALVRSDLLSRSFIPPHSAIARDKMQQYDLVLLTTQEAASGSLND